MALETVLSVEAGIVMIQKPFIGNRGYPKVDSIFTGHKEKRKIQE